MSNVTFQPVRQGYDAPVTVRQMILGCCLGFLSAASAFAQVPDDAIRLEFLQGWRTDRGTHVTGLQISLQDGWKTYWRAPGEGGIPPRFDWQGSRNLGSVELHWPTPEVFRTGGVQAVGYTRDLVLPLEFTAEDPSKPVQVTARVFLGVCEEVCLPVTLQIAAELSPDRRQPDDRITAAMADRPMTAAEMGVSRVECRFAPIPDGLRVTASVSMNTLGRDETAVFELPDRAIWIGPSETRREGATLTATAEMVPPEARPFLVSRSDLRITVLADGQAVNIQGCTG